jgi:hypothetical protein
VLQKNPWREKVWVAFIALNRKGETGAYSTRPGFEYALTKNGATILIKSDSYFKE